MKKRSGLKRALPIVGLEDLKAQGTRQLLARLKRLRFCEDSPELSDLCETEIASAKSLILFKSQDEWKRAYHDIKTVLADRDNIE